VEAAHALTYCRDGVVHLAANPPTDTCATTQDAQRQMGESMNPPLKIKGRVSAVDEMLRYLASYLLQNEKEELDVGLLKVKAGEYCVEVASGLVFLRNRIQVPRDMTAPAAATLREVLVEVATGLVGKEVTLSLLIEHQGPYQTRIDVRSRY
jgi:hypothetical protein